MKDLVDFSRKLQQAQVTFWILWGQNLAGFECPLRRWKGAGILWFLEIGLETTLEKADLQCYDAFFQSECNQTSGVVSTWFPFRPVSSLPRRSLGHLFKRGICFWFIKYSLMKTTSDLNVSRDAGIKPRSVATWLDLIRNLARSLPIFVLLACMGIDWGKGIDGLKSIYPNRSKANRSSWPIFLMFNALLRIRIRLGSGFNGVPESGFMGGKNYPQKWKKLIN